LAWQQAVDWLMRMHESALDAAAEKQLSEWLDAAPAHVKAFREACTVWLATGVVSSRMEAALGAWTARGDASCADGALCNPGKNLLS
jgi:ferric-dicitrate binding protein FerR (iron transport regulator)